jgi:hypothetical protein
VHERALSNPFPFFFSFFWVSFRGSGSAHFTSMGLLENSECESTLPSRFKLCARAVAVLHSRTPTYNEHLVTVAGAEIRIYSDIWDGKKWDLCHAEQSLIWLGIINMYPKKGALLLKIFFKKKIIKRSHFSSKVGREKSQPSPYVPPGLV